jgi:hypothetical protein
LANDQRAGLHVEGVPYVRLEGRNLRLLSSMAGRPEKNRRPEAPEYRLDTGSAAIFQGGWSVHLMSPMPPRGL